MGTWDSLLSQIEVRKWGDNYVSTPGPASLDEYEAATGSRLPESYRQFILRFGPGELAEKFTIAAPGYSEHRSSQRIDLAVMNRRFQDLPDDFFASGWDDPRQARRLILFCERTGGADYCGWDPEDVRDPAAPEYGIYALWHGDRRVMNVAGSFHEFIEDYLFGDNYLKYFGAPAVWAEEEADYEEDEEAEEGEPGVAAEAEGPEAIPRHKKVFHPAQV
jgi:hypothetical protein